MTPRSAILAGVVLAATAHPASFQQQSGSVPAPPVGDIMQRAADRLLDQDERGAELAFESRIVTTVHTLDGENEITKTETTLHHRYPLEGELYEELVERDGEPLDAGDRQDERERRQEFLREVRERDEDDDPIETNDERQIEPAELFERFDATVTGIETVDGARRPVPEGYGENGIWIRGDSDYADPRVAGAIGTGQNPSMLAWVGNARWIERRIALVDAVRQVQAVRAGRTFLDEERRDGWRDVETRRRFRFVRWVGGMRDYPPRRTPPVRMRLRCWYEVVVSDAKGKRMVLREEGLRGDTARTTERAIERWRKSHPKRRDELLLVHEIRIAKRQPRPMPPD